MIDTPIPNIQLSTIQSKLASFSNSLEQQEYLDKVIGETIYTDLQLAKQLQQVQFSILLANKNEQYELTYILNEAFIQNQEYKFKEAELTYLNAITVVEEIGSDKLKASTYIDYAGTCFNLKKYDKSEEYLNKASTLMRDNPADMSHAYIHCRRGHICLALMDFPKAIEFFIEAEKIFLRKVKMKIKDKLFLTYFYNGMGEVFDHVGDIEKSINYRKSAVSICKSNLLYSRLSWHLLNLGKGLLAIGNHDEAIQCFKETLEVKGDSHPSARAGALANLGICYVNQQKLQYALDCFDEAEELYEAKEVVDNYNLSIIDFWRSEIFEANGKDKLRLKFLKSAFAYAKEGKDYRHLTLICKRISNYYEDKNDFKTAFEYLKYKETLQEQFNEDNTNKAIRELKAKYDVEKKEQESKMLKLEAVGLKLKALRAQMNPHFMFNALNGIQKFITSNEMSKAELYLAKFSALVRKTLEYSDKEEVSLENEITFLKEYLDINNKLRYANSLKYTITVHEDIEEDIMYIPTMVIQPFVENAIVHGLRSITNGHIKINFNLIDDDMILCIVEDNGLGRDRVRQIQERENYQANHRSKGALITQDRLNLLDKSTEGRLKIKHVDMFHEDGTARGTRVEIKIPVLSIRV